MFFRILTMLREPCEEGRDQTMSNCQNINTLTTLIIFVTISILWISLQTYAFSSAPSPTSLNQLTDSKGEICGEGEDQGRGNLLYYDITKCAELENCRSAKVRSDNFYLGFSAEQWSSMKHSKQILTTYK